MTIILLPNAPVQRRAAQRTVRWNRLLDAAFLPYHHRRYSYENNSMPFRTASRIEGSRPDASVRTPRCPLDDHLVPPLFLKCDHMP